MGETREMKSWTRYMYDKRDNSNGIKVDCKREDDKTKQ